MRHVLYAVLFFILLISKAESGFGPGEQDYGYVTVRPGAHMFWWLYHTTANVTDSAERPIIVWLMGGPGLSGSGEANFWFVGPLTENLEPRENSWVKDYNILFVDNPVGVGYSYVDDTSALTTNNYQIAKDLVAMTKGFLDALPKFKTTPFYIYGISYGGKMGVEYAKLLNEEIQAGNLQCNFKGVSMGNAWISPVESSLHYGRLLYQMSLVDERGLAEINKFADHIEEVQNNGEKFQTTLEWFRMLQTIEERTDGYDMYDLRSKSRRFGRNLEDQQFMKVPKKSVYNLNSLMNGPVKEALEIPEHIVWGGQSIFIFYYLYEDYMLSVTNIVESILNDTNIEVHVCNGNFDLTVPTTSVLSWIDKLRWKNREDHVNAERTTIWVNDTMEGYIKQGGGLSFYWINGAGHFAISGNPAATKVFLQSVTGV